MLGFIPLEIMTKRNETLKSRSNEHNDEEGELYFTPRILIGVLSDSQSEIAHERRQRQRQLFIHWKNDPRICSLQGFLSHQEQWDKNRKLYKKDMGHNHHHHQIDCQVIYSFVLGGSTKNSSIPTVRLNDTPDQPLLYDSSFMLDKGNANSSNFKRAHLHYDALDNKDSIFLNIVENMNDGKTATFIYWASKFAKKWDIPFVAKCDDDTFLDIELLLDFMQSDLPPIPISSKKPSVMAGYLWHKKVPWHPSTDQSFWELQFYLGFHMYLMGGFFLLSADLAEEATVEAHYYRQAISQINTRAVLGKLSSSEAHGYLEGIEDHDTISMAIHGHYQSLRQKHDSIHPSVIQWVNMPKHMFFFKHPVKELSEWSRNLKQALNSHRDVVKQAQVLAPPFGTERANVRTLVLIYNAGNIKTRIQYRQNLSLSDFFGQSSTKCLGHHKSSDCWCDVQHLFLVGNNENQKSSSKSVLHNEFSLASSLNTSSANFSDEENDVLYINNVDDNDHLALALAATSHLHELNLAPSHYDAVIFCEASHMVNVTQWNDAIVSTAQYSLLGEQNKHLLIGDVRVRNTIKKKREFPIERDGVINWYFLQRYNGMHLYLGSDCFGLSASLIPALVESAFNPKVKLSLKGTGHLGHDLTYLAYAADEIKLHWMPVPKSMHFWIHQELLNPLIY
jgi:hypothetical protein